MTNASRFSDVCPLILAAGKGKRMGNNGDLPKVMCELHNKTLIEHLLEHIEQSRLSITPTIVVGHGGEHIKKLLGDRVGYVEQEDQQGTGHAVMSARGALEGKCGHVLVLYGDHPYVPAYVINELVSLHKGRGATVTLTSSLLPDFEAWREDLYVYGRVVRDSQRHIEKIVEFKDATEQQKNIKEVNIGYYCFEATWLWGNIDALRNNNAQKEFYITDLVQMAIEQGKTVASFTIDPIVGIGVNTKEQLERAHKLIFGT